jgi:hypothetical protein
VDKGVPRGIVFDFVNILKDKYGFNYTVKMPKENIMGDAETGIISMVHKKVSATKDGLILHSSCWNVTPYWLVNNYRSFGGEYCLHLQSQSIQGDRNIPKDLNLHEHLCENQKSRVSHSFKLT